MKGNYVVLQIRLDAIRNFLDHVKNDAENEIRVVLARNESGEFQKLDDLDNALHHPIARQEIAARAVYYELNALIEHELQVSAHLPWLESDKHRGPKGLDLNNLKVKAVESLKMIQDVSFSSITRLIESKYSIKLRELEGGEAFFKMRRMVNAFKHRNGLVDFRKQADQYIRFPQYHQPEIEEAFAAISNADDFVLALWQATDRWQEFSVNLERE
ncbi:MAG: hypothetical protein AABN95_02355 [Acidobacteriota bacterium]